mgnify:CR=1 FL=1
MSILAMTWAWGLMDLDQSQTLVLLALADAANDDGVCWPSQAEIGRKARLKDRAVRNQIRSLEAMGLVSVSSRSTSQGRKTNVYRLNVGCDFSLQSKQPARNAGWVEGSDSQPVDNSTFRCNQSNRHEMPVGDPTGTVMPVATGTVMPVATLYQTPNIQTPNLTPPPPVVEGSVGLGTGFADRVAAEGESASPVATSVPPEGRRGPQKPRRSPKSEADRGAESASEADLAILAACVPASMRVMDARGLGLVVDLLRERLDAGWTPGEIKRLLDSPLPDRVARMSGFVASRLRRLVAVGESPRAQAAAAARERERLEAERAAAEDERVAQTAPSLLHMRIHDLAKEMAPGLSPARCAVVELAVQQALVDAWRRENPQGGKPSPSVLLEVLAASGEQIAGRVIAEHVDGEVA